MQAEPVGAEIGEACLDLPTRSSIDEPDSIVAPSRELEIVDEPGRAEAAAGPLAGLPEPNRSIDSDVDLGEPVVDEDEGRRPVRGVGERVDVVDDMAVVREGVVQ